MHTLCLGEALAGSGLSPRKQACGRHSLVPGWLRAGAAPPKPDFPRERTRRGQGPSRGGSRGEARLPDPLLSMGTPVANLQGGSAGLRA